MRFAYISTSALPSRSANSVHVMKMCQALGDAGHDVTLLAPSQPSVELPGVDDIHEYYGVRPVFRILKKPFPRLPGRALIYAFACLRALRRLRPDFVYGRYFPAVGLACMRGFPCAYESHEKLWERGRVVRRLMRHVFASPNFRQLIVISDALAGFYRDADLEPPCGMTVAHDAADRTATEAGGVDTVFDPAFKLHCGYVGSLFRGRGVELLLDCAVSLPDCCFHFVGGHPDDIERIREERGGTPENAVFHGHLPPPDAARLRLAFDLLLAPYQRSVAVWGGTGDTSSFMSPLKIFEYMAAGKPILCSDMPVLREVLDESCSILLAPDDAGAWTAAIAALRDDGEQRALLGAAALEEFERHHSWEKRAAKIAAACHIEPVSEMPEPSTQASEL